MLRRNSKENSMHICKHTLDPMVKGKNFGNLVVPRINVRKNRWPTIALQLLEA